MNLEDCKMILISIQFLADQQAGYLEGVRTKLPLSHGGNDELDQSIDMNKRILREASDGATKIPIKYIRERIPSENDLGSGV